MLSNWSPLVGRGTDFFLDLLTRWRGRSVQVGEHEVYGWENLNQCLQVRYHHLEQDEHISCPFKSIHPFLERYHCFHSVTSGIRAAKLHPSQSPLLLFWEREPSQVIAIRSNIHWTLFRPPGRFPQSSWHCHQLWQSRGLLLFFFPNPCYVPKCIDCEPFSKTGCWPDVWECLHACLCCRRWVLKGEWTVDFKTFVYHVEFQCLRLVEKIGEFSINDLKVSVW